MIKIIEPDGNTRNPNYFVIVTPTQHVPLCINDSSRIGKTVELINTSISFPLLLIHSAISGFVSPAVGYNILLYFDFVTIVKIALNRFWIKCIAILFKIFIFKWRILCFTPNRWIIARTCSYIATKLEGTLFEGRIYFKIKRGLFLVARVPTKRWRKYH